MSLSNITSFYIPRVEQSITEEYIVATFQNTYIGYVDRVDFTQIGTKPGFREPAPDARFKTAYVHFHSFMDSDLSLQIRSQLEEGKEEGGYKFYINNRSYWILLKNRRPVQQTLMNINQVVDNARVLEDKMAEQATQMEYVRSTVYQLVGGLFNQRTQTAIGNLHIGALYDGPVGQHSIDTDTSKWGIWPTTRQGDENSAKIEVLEEKVETQAKIIQEQADKLECMEEQMKSIRSVVYQLLGGLFNAETQKSACDFHVSVLFNEKEPEEKTSPDTSKWGHFPTTIQGDDNSARIEVLEKLFTCLLDDLQKTSDEREQEEDSLACSEDDSTYSSMPSLMSVSDSEDSMPSLVSVSDNEDEVYDVIDSP
jgi:hypothetical protein